LIRKQAGVVVLKMGFMERQGTFGGINERVPKQAAAAVHNRLIPLICIEEKTHSSIASAAVTVAVEQ